MEPTIISDLPVVDPYLEDISGTEILVVKGLQTRRMRSRWLTDVVERADGVAAVAEHVEGYSAALAEKADAVEAWYASVSEDALVVGQKLEEAQTAVVASVAANTSATQTAADMQTALANVENYDNTLGLLSPIAKQIVAATDVVDHIVYDTRFDSDGGAWRDRCSHLSWFKEALNTATRGATRKFPQKALIVSRAASVTIYDMDAPSCPMWMVFNRGGSFPNGFMIGTAGATFSSVTMLNGVLVSGGSNYNVTLIDFLLDNAILRATSNTIAYLFSVNVAGRNATSPLSTIPMSGAINGTVNDVAATVLPGTPIDPVRGLPNPTIAVATAGGVSVIHWDGRVHNITGFPGTAANKVFIDSNNLLYVARYGGVDYGAIPHTDQSVSGEWRYSVFLPDAGAPYVNMKDGNAAALSERAIGGASGLFKHSVPPRLPKNAVISQVTSKFATGFQVGTSLLALSASAADLTTLVAATPLEDDFSTYADTAAMVAAGWSAPSANVTATIVSGRLEFECVTGFSGTQYAGRKALVLAANTTYRVEMDVENISGGFVNLIALVNGTAGNGGTSLGGQVSLTNTATKAAFTIKTGASLPPSPVLEFLANSLTVGQRAAVDNITIRKVAEDRSVAGNHPVIVGSVTREVVAAGADLAAYGGFSASNYLEVPYSSAFDFGTGDFSISVWVKANSTSASTVLSKGPIGSNPAPYFEMQSFSGSLVWVSTAGAGSKTFGAFTVGQWHHYSYVRASGVGSAYRDGVLIEAEADTSNYNHSNTDVLRVGYRQDGGSGAFPGSVAVLRISATAPTPAQIRAMYEAERPLFQANAKCLLSGSDNVQGLSYDDTTDLLYVAKAAGGTDVFKGLERIGSITMASDSGLTSDNHRGVSAKDGVVSIRTPNEVYASAPAVPLRPKLIEGTCTRLYDRDEATTDAVTTDATPKVIAKFPLAKGERGVFTITVRASQYADGAAYASYVYRFHAYRPEEGNIALRGAVTETILGESNAAMAVAITANTTTQTLDVTATGLAATNLVWTVEMERA